MPPGGVDGPELLLRRRRRNLTVTNEFAVPVVVHRVDVPDEVGAFVEVVSLVGSAGGGAGPREPLSPPVVLLPGQTVDLLELRLRDAAWELGRVLDSFVTLRTNVSSMDIRIVCFHGKLDTVSFGKNTH